MFVWQAHEGAVTSLAFAPGAGLLSSGVDGNVRFWDPAAGATVHAWKYSEPAKDHDNSNILRVLSDATGTHAAVGLRKEGVQFVRLADGVVAAAFPLALLHEFAPSPSRESVFACGNRRGRSAYLWELGFDARIVATSPRLESGLHVKGLVVSPDGSTVIVGRNRLNWRDHTFDKLPMTSDGPMFAVSADGDKLFGVNGSRLMVWGFQVGAFRQSLKGHVARITALTATPDGRKMWTASADATVRQWDVESYRCERCYSLKIGPIGCVAVSPDGLTAAAGSSLRGLIAMWDLE